MNYWLTNKNKDELRQKGTQPQRQKLRKMNKEHYQKNACLISMFAELYLKDDSPNHYIAIHFEMVQTGVFFKPQRRKANEGVRISHLDPETRMNSRDEFRQGTNIMMRAMRGVGV